MWAASSATYLFDIPRTCTVKKSKVSIYQAQHVATICLSRRGLGLENEMWGKGQIWVFHRAQGVTMWRQESNVSHSASEFTSEMQLMNSGHKILKLGGHCSEEMVLAVVMFLHYLTLHKNRKVMLSSWDLISIVWVALKRTRVGVSEVALSHLCG